MEHLSGTYLLCYSPKHKTHLYIVYGCCQSRLWSPALMENIELLLDKIFLPSSAS